MPEDPLMNESTKLQPVPEWRTVPLFVNVPSPSDVHVPLAMVTRPLFVVAPKSWGTEGSRGNVQSAPMMRSLEVAPLLRTIMLNVALLQIIVVSSAAAPPSMRIVPELWMKFTDAPMVIFRSTCSVSLVEMNVPPSSENRPSTMVILALPPVNVPPDCVNGPRT